MRLRQGECPQSRVIWHVQVQHIGTEPLDGLRQRGTEPQSDGGVDQLGLHRHPHQPGRVVGQGVAMHQRSGVDALRTLGMQQVGQEHFHAAPVRREEFADV